MKTTQISGARYGIGVIESNADLEKIVDALSDKGVEVDDESTLNNVFVSPENVSRAVEIINGLGYSTDEDPHQDKDEQ